MQVIHGLWDTETFCIWSESSETPLISGSSDCKRENHAYSHPFALAACDLSSLSLRCFPDERAKIKTLHLSLPAGSHGLLPSPWLLLDDYPSEKPTHLADCQVSALAYDMNTALNLLLDLPIHPPQGIVYAHSLLFWSKLALFSLELVSRQQFVPTLQGDCALWKSAIDNADQERVKLFVKSIPPSCLCLSKSPFLAASKSQSSPQNPSSLVNSFLDKAADCLVRSSLKDAAISIPRRGRPPKSAAMQHQFLKALVNKNPADAILKASAKELSDFRAGLSSWMESILPQAVDVPFRTCFRLEAPVSDNDVNANDTWRLSIFLQANDDKSLLVPASEIWKTRSSALTLLKRRLKNPQERLLADLGKAERVLPQMGECLETARPTAITMNTEAAYSFLREKAPLLEKNGFGVLLPSWWQRSSSNLGIKLRLKDKSNKSGSVGPSFLGLNTLIEYDWQLSLGDNSISEAEFLELSRLKVPLVRIRGEWTELRSQEIEEAIAFFKKNRSHELTLAEALRLGLDPSSQELIEGDGVLALPILGVSSEGRIDEILKSLSQSSASLEPISPPQDLQGILRPYQLRGVSWLEYLCRLGLGACLADDMGLGKTVELIAFLLRRKEEGAKNPTLLVCPLSVTGNWQKEIERFAPTLSCFLHHGAKRLSGQDFLREASCRDVVITTYSLAAKDEDLLCSVPWGQVVLDEAQSIKNHEAMQTRSIKRLPAGYRIARTGTPVENRLSELWSIMDFLNPGLLGSSRSFQQDFILPIEKYNNRSRSQSLRSIIQPFILRRLKTDPTVIKDLPDKLEMKVNYNLTEEQASLYSAVVEGMMQDIESLGGIKRKGVILSTLTKLKQICNHPALFLQDASALEGRSGKLTRLEEMLDEAGAEGDRSLIFTQFAGMGAMLRHHLQEKTGQEVLFLHGKTPKKKRDEMVARFQSGDSLVFILSLKAGGFGLNLTAANHVFHFDRWWNPAVENQATDRAFRIGQKKNVFVHKFVCIGTLEERIDQMIDQKKSLADSIIGSGEAWLTELSNEALRDMLTLHLDDVKSGGDEI